MPTLPFQIESSITTRRETWRILTKVAETFLTSYNEYSTKIVNLAPKLGVSARESKECGRDLIGSRRILTSFGVVLVPILAS
jgi:hypothetical protein